MARVFITGSGGGLGRLAAETLRGDGHEVIAHARATQRLDGWAGPAIVGDLADMAQTRDGAEQVNRLGPLDAVIHNAGVYSGPHVLPVNIVAPYLLTALIDRPQRLIYLTSDMHEGGRADLADVDWTGQ